MSSMWLRSLCCAAWMACAAVPLQAQELPQAPAPAAPRPLTIATPNEQRLPKGLRVIVAERHGVPLVTAGRAGLAALARMAEALGASIESEAGWDSASVGMTGMTPVLRGWLFLPAESGNPHQAGVELWGGGRYDARRLAGLMDASAQTKNPSTAEVVGLIEQQLDEVMDRPAPDAELEARRARLIGTCSRTLETTEGLAGEVQAFAQSHFGPEKRRVAVVGVAAEFVPALAPRTGAPRVLPQAELDLEAPLPAPQAAAQH